MFPGDPQNGKLHKTASALCKRQTVKLLCHYVCLPTEGLDVLLKDAFTSAPTFNFKASWRAHLWREWWRASLPSMGSTWFSLCVSVDWLLTLYLQAEGTMKQFPAAHIRCSVCQLCFHGWVDVCVCMCPLNRMTVSCRVSVCKLLIHTHNRYALFIFMHQDITVAVPYVTH